MVYNQKFHIFIVYNQKFIMCNLYSFQIDRPSAADVGFVHINDVLYEFEWKNIYKQYIYSFFRDNFQSEV